MLQPGERLQRAEFHLSAGLRFVDLLTYTTRIRQYTVHLGKLSGQIGHAIVQC